MNIKMLERKNKGMALGLVLLLVLAGFAFVGVSSYVVTNMFTTSQSVTAKTRLYNAAQSGIEWGLQQIWVQSADLNVDPVSYDGNLDSIRVMLADDVTPLANGLTPPGIDPGITVSVLFLDCNYNLNGHSPTANTDLPPQQKAGLGTGTGTGTPSIPVGTSAIVDPNRFMVPGGGGGSHRYVVRSTATPSFSILGGAKKVELEVMVVINR
jgi:hypothetical protein